ncbi:MAG: hypothetical protein COV66_06550 [Nitrospinae bacterium CG11_big_fil_rev_8_21_14_0_20_45_15]|nr:MAG: hypothetical protein COV66_06550 [Nitrospinae bacterium CG11_big_fil_rev_8_21_14_0_20_45_15]
MNPQLKLLVSLQKIKDSAMVLEKSLAAIPGQIKGGAGFRDEKQKLLKEAQDEIDALKKKRRDLESAVQNENDHMAKIKVKLPNVKTNKEYQAIIAEVDVVKEKVSKIEDQELEVMEILESKEKALPAIKKACQEEEEKFKAYEKKKAVEAERVKAELEGLALERAKITDHLEKAWLKKFDQLTKAREGVAVVELLKNICGGCHQHILPQTIVNAKIGKDIQECSSCLRLLYWVEESEEEQAPK